MIADLNDMPHQTVVECDVRIIGSGSAGLSLSLEFANTPYRVVVLESGGFAQDENLHKATDPVTRSLSLRDDSRSWVKAFGGTLNVWGGGWQLINEVDFEKHPARESEGLIILSGGSSPPAGTVYWVISAFQRMNAVLSDVN